MRIIVRTVILVAFEIKVNTNHITQDESLKWDLYVVW
jgi:hypothetical protein